MWMSEQTSCRRANAAVNVSASACSSCVFLQFKHSLCFVSLLSDGTSCRLGPSGCCISDVT